MDYLQGQDLVEYIEKNGFLSEVDGLKYITQIGSALAYFHQQGYLHRDVKP